MAEPLRPGAICALDASPRRVLLLDPRGDGFDAVPYPVPEKPSPAPVAADRLRHEGWDAASARVLLARQRTQASAQSIQRTEPIRRVRTAMVLCAGLGLRLRPLTLAFPKPALPFFGGPLIRYSLALLKTAGVERVVINTHHLPELMAESATREAARLGLTLDISHEPVVQGTAGGLREARRFLEGEPFLLLNGDAFLSLDLAELIGEHQRAGASATMALAPMPPGEHFNAVEARADLTVRRISGVGAVEPGLTPWHFVGVHVIEPEILDFIPGTGPQDINRDAYPAAIAAGRRVHGCPVALGAWADMGTPLRYLQACEEVMTGLCDLGGLGAWSPIDEALSARLRGAGIDGRVVVDPTSRIDPSAHLERAQIGPGVEVGADATVRDAAVLPGTRILPGERVEHAIACGELRLEAR